MWAQRHVYIYIYRIIGGYIIHQFGWDTVLGVDLGEGKEMGESNCKPLP